MSLLIISIFVNCLVLIASAQEEAVATASASASASSVENSSTPCSGESKPRTVPKIYTECGSACPVTCARPEPGICMALCRPGWSCPKDYYENSAGKCVLLADCDSASTTTEPVTTLVSNSVSFNDSRSWSSESKSQTASKIYNECGTACPLTCAQPKERSCIKICKAGWFCPKGFYENSAGKCVLLENCDSASTEAPISSPFPTNNPSSSWPSEFKPRTVGKIYNECGSACPKTCAQPNDRPCILICKSGWFCPNDYYENSAGQCVLLEDCNTGSKPTRHLPGHIVGRPRPRPGNFGGFPTFPTFPNFPEFNATENEIPKITLPMGPSRPRPIFRFDPVYYNATAVANGAPVPPPAVVRTSGSNLPYIRTPSMVPKAKPLIDLDPTVLRPALRVSQEQSSDADN